MKCMMRKSITALSLVGAVFLTACSDDNDDSDINIPAMDGSTANIVLDDAGLELLEGNWEQRGYGNLYTFADNRTTWFSLLENSCLEIVSFEGLIGLTDEEISQTRYSLDGDQLTLALPGEAFELRFERLDAVPDRCNEPVANDAQAVFDYLWETFDEYYAFFNLRNVDWNAQFALQVPRVAEVVDDDSLFSLLSDLLSPIDDGHVLLLSDTDFFTPAAADRGVEFELLQGFSAQSDITDIDVYVDSVLGQFRETIISNLDVNTIVESERLSWGITDDGSTGYLFIEAMQGYATDPDGSLQDDPSASDDLMAAGVAMDTAMADLADTEHLIIDLRLNGGGRDSISIEFARRFVSDRQVFFTKSARSRDFESVPVTAFLDPVETPYLNPVTLIVSADTASAAETFAIPLQSMPQVRVVGDSTRGILSDILVKPLPNGWTAGLSNEVYLDSEGTSYEGTGVPIDIEVPAFQLEDIEAGVDPALERALMLP